MCRDLRTRPSPLTTSQAAQSPAMKSECFDAHLEDQTNALRQAASPLYAPQGPPGVSSGGGGSADLLEDRLFGPAEAARYVGLRPKTLANLRCRGGGPLFVKLSRSRVGYLRSDLDAWRTGRRVRSTAEAFVRRLG